VQRDVQRANVPSRDEKSSSLQSFPAAPLSHKFPISDVPVPKNMNMIFF
jgi:hypothetical protein